MKKDKIFDRPVEEYTTHPPFQSIVNNTGMIRSDPLGSYTGRPTEKWEQPVQDADDL